MEERHDGVPDAVYRLGALATHCCKDGEEPLMVPRNGFGMPWLNHSEPIGRAKNSWMMLTGRAGRVHVSHHTGTRLLSQRLLACRGVVGPYIARVFGAKSSWRGRDRRLHDLERGLVQILGVRKQVGIDDEVLGLHGLHYVDGAAGRVARRQNERLDG